MNENSPANGQKLKNKLILIDINQKLHYYHGFKITINTMKKCLIMSKKAKKFVAYFDKRFYRFNNFLSIIDPVENIANFMIIFKSDSCCEKAFNAIQKYKAVKDINSSTDKLFDQLIHPMLNGIQSNENLKKQLQPIMMELFISFDGNDRQKCIKCMKETNFIDDILNIETLATNNLRFLDFVKAILASSNLLFPSPSNDSTIASQLSTSASTGSRRTAKRKKSRVLACNELSATASNSTHSNLNEEDEVVHGGAPEQDETGLENSQRENCDLSSSNRLENVTLKQGDRIFSLIDPQCPHPADKEHYFQVFTGILITSNGKICCPYCNLSNFKYRTLMWIHVADVHGIHNSLDEYVCPLCTCPLKMSEKANFNICKTFHEKYCRGSYWYEFVKDKTCHSS